jgi:adenosine deaminase
MPPPLAELHLHLYGCLRGTRVLDMLARRDRPAWERYEPAFARAYGRNSPARELVERHRAGDTTAAAEFEQLFVFGEDDAGSFTRFQAKFDLIAAASVVGLAAIEEDYIPHAVDEIRNAARAVLEDQAREGVHYAEHRFFFGASTSSALIEEGLTTLLRVFAESDRPIARLAPSLPRSDPWRHWEIVRRLALSDLGPPLAGIDFCFIEEGHPPKDQRALFAAVRQHNVEHPERALAILYHVGESFEDKSLESAVRWVHEAAELGAHRLGHAIALGVDPDAYGAHVRRESAAERLDQIAYDLRHAEELARFGVHVDCRALEREAELLAARSADEQLQIVYDHRRLHEVRARQRFAMSAVRAHGAVVEVCPTSNLRIGGLRDPQHHPVQRFLAEGVPVVVASDDPGIFGTTLRDELAWVAEHAELDAAAVDELIARAWASRSERLTGRER